MKVLILNADYEQFLRQLYQSQEGLSESPYSVQMDARNASLFGVADFYSSNLRRLGHEAWDVHVNNPHMQKMWASEHCPKAGPTKKLQFRMRRGVLPWISSVVNDNWLYDVLAAQIAHYKPDIIFNQALLSVPCRFLRDVKSRVRLIVGQHAATKLPNDDWQVYDVMTSSFPPTVEWFQSQGVRAVLNRLGFEPRILERLPPQGNDTGITFIGSFTHVHSTRVEWIEYLLQRFPIKVYAPSIEGISPGSPIVSAFVGPAWGLEMYRVLQNSLVTLNHHGNVPPFANNMRLYEATGVGATLLTDWKPNLHEMFEPGCEVAAYKSNEDCARILERILSDDRERTAIGEAGQLRTLKDHTYDRRVHELLGIVGRLL